MKKIFVMLLAALCLGMSALAVPAYRGWITRTQPDGTTVKVRLHGDEFCHWMTDENGQVLEEGKDGFFRPVQASVHAARLAAGRRFRAQVNAVRRSPAKAGVATGQKHFLVILVEFYDVHFENGASDFENLLNQSGYSVNGGTGSARDFYYQNSHGAFEPIFDVYGPVRLENNRAHYGADLNNVRGNDTCPEDAVIEGCKALDSTIDFTQYDNDGDGEVDLVFMYYAGQGQADGGPAECIWPHQWAIKDGAGVTLSLDGKTINKYACTNEIVTAGELKDKLCGIGTACHEFGHAMGLPDFYDTDYDENGEAGGLYDYSLMCSGSYNNAGRTPPYFNIEERIMLGWLDEGDVLKAFPESGTYTLTSINDNQAYKTLTDQEGEYFVYECRSNQGWDAYLPEHGLIVYHIDKSSRQVSIYSGSSTVNQTAKSLWDNWDRYNSINENGEHPCFYVVPAGAQTNLNYNGSKWAFPGTAGKTWFTAQSWNGVESEVKISSIVYASNQISLYATVPSSSLNYNVIANPGNGVYTAGSSFALEMVESAAQPVASVQWYFDDEPVSGPSVTLSAGAHVVEAHLTLTSGETKIVELAITVQ